eukprot:TRINITY_DN5383_c0_g2_i1.p1 TRINITY_DN5383_c0_g2~~TRINITY_DN5383_c0_g2_i1.p1  ORF type:complete len:447 (+),score=135.34 TRINITY_DN5383_c0_g2_i1:61-1341(+)
MRAPLLLPLICGVAVADDLLLTVHVSRHSIKAPSLPNLTEYTSHKFNASGFGAKPGSLTAHGRVYAAAVGAHYGGAYRQPGGPLSGATTCADVADRLFVYADSEERDRTTAAELLGGLAPGCKLDACCADPAGQRLVDYVFTEGQEDRQHPGCSWAGEDDALRAVGGDPAGYVRSHSSAELQQLSSLADCCSPAACPSSAECTLADVPDTWSGGYYTTFTGGWSAAGKIAALWFTRFVEGLPSPLAAGAVEQTQAGTADLLFDVYRSVDNAVQFGSDFVAHLAASLQLSATGKVPAGVSGGVIRHTASTKLLWYVGHDCQLAWVRLLAPLGGWKGGQPYPFLSSLVLELWRTGSGTEVRAHLDFGSPADIRELRSPPVGRQPLTFPEACGGDRTSCEVGAFVNLLLRKAKPQCALPELQSYIKNHQ